MPTLKLFIPALREPEDQRRLEEAFAREPGVYTAVAIRCSHSLEIDFEDDEVTPSRLIALALAEGYEASIAS